MFSLTYLLTYLLAYLLIYLFTYLLTSLLQELELLLLIMSAEYIDKSVGLHVLCRRTGVALRHRLVTSPAYVTTTSSWLTRSVLCQLLLRSRWACYFISILCNYVSNIEYLCSLCSGGNEKEKKIKVNYLTSVIVRYQVSVNPLKGTLKPQSNEAVIQQYGDWYTGRWWVGCYIWYSEEEPGRAGAPPRPLLAVPNVTAHPSTASVPTLYCLM